MDLAEFYQLIINKEFFLAHDCLGIKPLYYYHDNNYFVFGSDITAMLELPLIKKEI